MPNPYFRFKQFTILQDCCAMKVGTDGVLLGAWTDITETQRILDIGTGTGLIALMLAQRSFAQIDAIEIDAEACQQAGENMQRSPWAERLQVSHCSIQDYTATCTTQYDLLVANPPFFQRAYKAPQVARAIARHSDSLQQSDLLQAAARLLQPMGRLAVIYPPAEAQSFQTEAKNYGFFCNRKLWVQSTSQSQIKRVLMELSQSQTPYQEASLTLETARHVYTPEWIDLVKDFYLHY